MDENPLIVPVVLLLIGCIALTCIGASEHSITEELKTEAIRRGFAEYVVDQQRPQYTKFQWKETK